MSERDRGDEGAGRAGRSADATDVADDLGFVADAAAARRARDRQRTRVALGVSLAITLGWAVAVTVTGWWGRVADNWVATVTMVFGSFVAGSTPQGGGAVAFPVFTKGLQVPSEVARTFSLCVQTIGMGTATIAIIVRRRRVEWRAVAIGVGAGSIGLLAGLFLLHDTSRPFWPSVLPGPYVRVTFSIVIVAMAATVYLGTRVPVREVRRSLPSRLGLRGGAVVAVGALIGGLTASLTGSGADVLVYLAIVVLMGLDPRVGIPTSVVVMGTLSALGLVVVGLGAGALDTMLGPTGDVVAVGGQAVTMVDGTVVYGSGAGLPAGRFDLFGLWLAAVPVVCWGAPIGSAIASRWSARTIVVFAGCLALAEALSTVIFLDALRTDTGLVLYAVVALVVTVAALVWASANRHRITGQQRFDPRRSLARGDVDVQPSHREEVRRRRAVAVAGSEMEEPERPGREPRQGTDDEADRSNRGGA